ncbi:MAG TPA: ABC transporter substrate-binding protein [Solirubrobacterales bacterium]|nr:ABC transporter substrate-binding protein [Solirubrobacterales bacterium]
MTKGSTKLAALTLALVAALALSACGSSSSSSTTGSEGGTLKATFGSFPDSLDPGLAYTGEGSTAVYDVYVPLLTYAHASGSAGSKVIPGLAEAMPKITDGGRTYAMTLRKGLKYSDGTPVEASDFAASIERMFKLNSPGSPFYTDIVGAEEFAETKQGGISGISADDKSGKIVIHLVKPRGTFPNELALPFAAPVPAGTPAEDLTAKPPPATGPYEIVSAQPGRGWDYRRNPQWAGANAELLPQIPSGHVDRIEVDVLRNPATQVNDVESGRYDWMGNPPPADRYAEVKSKYEGSQFKVEPTISTYFFWMNTRQAPFDEVEVRQAVNYAVDARALERIYAGQISGTQQILPPGMPGYERFELYPHSLAKAKELVAAAKPSDREITVWTDNESPNDEAGEYLEGVLKELGFETTLKIVNADNYFGLIGNESTPNLDIGFANWFEDYPHPNDFFQPLLSGESIVPTGATNLARIDDPKLNDEITQLAEGPLTPQVESEYAELDRKFMEQAPWVPYGTSTLPTFVSSEIDLDQVVFNPTFAQDLTSFQFK